MSTGVVAIDDRAERAAAIHRRLVRRHLRRERSGRAAVGPSQPAAVPKPHDADGMLAALAACYAPGEAVTNSEVQRTADCTKGAAIALKIWARSAGLWPYAQALGMRQQKGEP